MPNTISVLPQAPTRENASTFAEDADAFLTALVTFRSELNEYGSDINNLTFKASCRAATTANITLSGLQTVDTVSLAAGDRVLVKNQSNDVLNGIYIVSVNSWTRAPDFDTSAKASVAFVGIREGAVNAGKIFYTTFSTGSVLGTSPMLWFGTTSLTLQSGNIPISGVMEPVTSAASLANARTALGIGQLSTVGVSVLGINSQIRLTALPTIPTNTSNPTISSADGAIQTWILPSASHSPTISMNNGEFLLLMIDDGNGGTITWPTSGGSPIITWKTNSGAAPTLNTTGYTPILLWMMYSIIFGARIGDA